MSKTAFLIASCVISLALLPAVLDAETADHKKFPELQKKFTRPEEVTAACLKCHNTAGMDVMKTSHWLWSRKTDKLPGKEGTMVDVGKKNVINNFCIALTSNEPRCTSCHIGYGWKDQNFDFSSQNKIDCLVCHEQTGTYIKFPAGAGYPAETKKLFKGNNKFYDPPDYPKVAQSVGRPNRGNCGACHFYGGGGNAVKHGALDKSLLKPDKTVDAHMGSDAGNMVCVDCHLADKHHIKGQLYSVSVEDRDRLSCERCHTRRPHTQNLFVEKYTDRTYDIFMNKLYERKDPEDSFIHRVLDKHIDRIACQTCHIKFYSTKFKTKIWWDWSKAGEKIPGVGPKMVKDADGDVIYDGMKGEFKLVKNAVPQYNWFNGNVAHILVGDKIDPRKTPVEINKISGACGEKSAKIWPFKVMEGKQPYDPVNNTFIIPKLFGPPGSGAYWADWDWGKSAEAGMKAAGVPYSGKYDWIETRMYWPLTHLILEKEKAMTCNDCHARHSRLSGLEACWIPARDRSLILDLLGMALVLGSLIGVSIHGIKRAGSSKKNKGGQ